MVTKTINHKFSKKQLLFCAWGLLIILLNVGCQQQQIVQSELDKQLQISSLYQQYAQEFEQVESITAKQLQQLKQAQQSLILVDVRSPQERAVSMIPGAISLEEFESNQENHLKSNAMIISYCTIGYRSGKYAEKLRQQGITIFNLEGSLLAWSHTQGKLINDNGLTNKIHIFGHQWQLAADNYQPVW